MAERKWILRNKKADYYALAEQFHIDPVIAKVLTNRDIHEEDFESFLHPMEAELHDPYLIEDMNQAVRVIIHGIEEGHKMRIISDYDVDGVMSNYILYRGMKRIGADVDYVIPHRIHDGYGISDEIVDHIIEDGIQTVVTCDNGIAAYSAVKRMKEAGIAVVITDHHEVPFEDGEDGEEKQYILPPADAILNSKKISCRYPYKDLCGAGVAYKFVECLYDKREIPREELVPFLDFVAVATICDVVPLTGENRVFVTKGLARLRQSENTGLRALVRVNELSDVTINAGHVGFRIGPCINASGRLESAIAAMELFLEENGEQALTKAQELKRINEERKTLTLQGVEQAEAVITGAGPDSDDSRDAVRIAADGMAAGVRAEHLETGASGNPGRHAEKGTGGILRDKVYVIYLPDCHESLAGIIAGRIRETYHHPTFVVTDSGEADVLKGSGRSTDNYHMYEALRQCSDLLLKFGGHAGAAGFSLKRDHLDAFRVRLNECCALTEDDFVPKLYIDVAMPISYVTEDLILQLEGLAPFGQGNPKPVFAQKDLNVLSAKIMGKDQSVVRVSLETPEGFVGEGIYFDAAEFSSNIIQWFGQEEYDKLLHGWLNNVMLNVVYYPAINEFNGTRTIQYRISEYSMAAVREVL